MKIKGVEGIKVVKSRIPYELELAIFDGYNSDTDDEITIVFNPLFREGGIKDLQKFVNDLTTILSDFDKEKKRIDLAHRLHIDIHANIRFKKLADIKKQAIDTRIQGLKYEELSIICYMHGMISGLNNKRMNTAIEAMITSMEEINWNTFYKQFPHSCLAKHPTGYDIFRAFESLVKKVRLE